MASFKQRELDKIIQLHYAPYQCLLPTHPTACQLYAFCSLKHSLYLDVI